MKGLSLHQPWPTFVITRDKTAETRGWRTAYRGPVLIASSKAIPAYLGLGRKGRRVIGDFEVEKTGPGQLLLRKHTDPGWPPYRLPLGCGVAVADLVDCCPIGGPYTFRTGTFEGDEGDYPGQDVVVYHQGYPDDPVFRDSLVIDHHDAEVEDITAQLPYGDFAPGRWAWMLANVRQLPFPVPCRGALGLWDVPLEVQAAVREQLAVPA